MTWISCLQGTMVLCTFPLAGIVSPEKKSRWQNLPFSIGNTFSQMVDVPGSHVSLGGESRPEIPP